MVSLAIRTLSYKNYLLYGLTSHSNTEIPPFFKHSIGNSSRPGALPDYRLQLHTYQAKWFMFPLLILFKNAYSIWR